MHTKKQHSQSCAWPESEAQCNNNTNCEDIDLNSFCVNLKCACNAGYTSMMGIVIAHNVLLSNVTKIKIVKNQIRTGCAINGKCV